MSPPTPGSNFSPPAPPSPRWWEYVEEGRIFCPAHHHMPNTFDVTEAGFTQCREWVHDSHRRHECGLWVFVLAIRGGGIIVAAVSPDERRTMRASLSTPAEMIRYLGIFTRGTRSSPKDLFLPPGFTVRLDLRAGQRRLP
jgi:hypothetical protein